MSQIYRKILFGMWWQHTAGKVVLVLRAWLSRNYLREVVGRQDEVICQGFALPCPLPTGTYSWRNREKLIRSLCAWKILDFIYVSGRNTQWDFESGLMGMQLCFSENNYLFVHFLNTTDDSLKMYFSCTYRNRKVNGMQAMPIPEQFIPFCIYLHCWISDSIYDAGYINEKEGRVLI